MSFTNTEHIVLGNVIIGSEAGTPSSAQ